MQKSSTDFYVQTSGGAAAVCGMEYSIVYIDRTYRQGNLAGASGSLAWIEHDGNVKTALLIRGYDVNATGTLMPFSVFQGFVVIDGKSVLPRTILKGDQATDFVGGYFDFAIMGALLKNKRLVIGFNREAQGGIDTTLPVDIAPSSNLKSFLDFSDCMLTLMDRAKTNLNKR